MLRIFVNDNFITHSTAHPLYSTLCLHTPAYYPKPNKFSIPFLRFPYIKSLILNKPCQSLNHWRLTNKLARENQHLLTQHFYFSHKAIALTRLNSNNQCFEFLQWTPSALSITWPTRDWLKTHHSCLLLSLLLLAKLQNRVFSNCSLLLLLLLLHRKKRSPKFRLLCGPTKATVNRTDREETNI